MAQEQLKPSDENDDEGLVARFKSWLYDNLSGSRADNSLKEALEEVLEEHQEETKDLPEEEQNMLRKVINFGELNVSDIMIPRAEIKAVEYTSSLDDLKSHLIKYGHTRVPVYNDTMDNVKGFIHIKDLLPLLSEDEPFNMALILREVLFVPPSMKLTDLLVTMRASGMHIAMVVDEYGGTDGLVTLEDIFEEIVGDIQDEHDEDEDNEPKLVCTPQGYCDVDARIRIDKLEKELAIRFERKDDTADYDTLGGFLFYKLGHVPIAGETIQHGNSVRFEILSANPRLIRKVRIYKLAEAVKESATA